MSYRSCSARQPVAWDLVVEAICISTLLYVLLGGSKHTFQRSMKDEAAEANKEVSNKADEEYRIMAMSSAALNSQVCKIHEPCIGQRIDKLRNVV